MKKGIIILASLLLLLCDSSFCQDLEGAGSKAKDKFNDALEKPITVSGGINAQFVSYSAFGIEPNRDPFLWQTALNLNFKLFNTIDMPFTATISSQQFDATLPSAPQPFNTFGASPKYKAFTAHLGYRTLNLSEFSLNGSQFLGVGLEVAPKDAFIKGKAMWGRFAEPVLFNPNGTVATTPTYARYGWGAGITLGRTPKNEVTFNIFKAKDIPESLDTNINDLTTRPSDNLVVGVVAKQKMSKTIDIEGEIDLSMLTEDVTVQERTLEGSSYINNIFLIQTNATTTTRKAMSFKANYKPSFGKIQLKYRRVDPGYRTLGTSYINNDYEDISVNTSIPLFKNKVNLSLLGGLQRNNLEQTKITNLVRLIGGVNASWKISDKWNSTLNFSNFNSTTRQVVVTTIDSLFFAQVTRSGGITLGRNASSDDKSTSILFSINAQDLVVNSVTMTQFLNANIGYNIKWMKIKTDIGISIVGVHSITQDMINSNLGPSLRVGKIFFKDKIQTSLTAAYLPSFVDMKLTGEIINATFTTSYAVTKAHKLGLNISNISKNNTGANSSSEVTATLNYNYAF